MALNYPESIPYFIGVSAVHYVVHGMNPREQVLDFQYSLSLTEITEFLVATGMILGLPLKTTMKQFFSAGFAILILLRISHQ